MTSAPFSPRYRAERSNIYYEKLRDNQSEWGEDMTPANRKCLRSRQAIVT